MHFLALAICIAIGCASGNKEETTQYWLDLGQEELKQRLFEKISLFGKSQPAKNIILFIGDGMGVASVTAARIFRGQKYPNETNTTNEQGPFCFEKFPFVGLSKTYSVDNHISDSACTATAILTGVKTKQTILGIGPEVTPKDCKSALKAGHLTTIADWALAAGKKVGVVTNNPITHATPAALYAAAASRAWQTDSDLSEEIFKLGCLDVSRQLIDSTPGNQLSVILGGGTKKFLGARRDKRSLLDEWMKLKPQGKRVYVNTKKDLLNETLVSNADYLLGLFAKGDLQYATDYALDETSSIHPSVPQMTEAAIKVLQKNEKGFFLLVENGLIDGAHHNSWAKRASEETRWLDKAIQKALAMTNAEETLIIVTADHSHTLTIGGYAPRSRSILGLTDGGESTILKYADGPSRNGIDKDGARVNLSKVDTEADLFQQPAFLYVDSASHGGEDVAVYATGPYSFLFTGLFEQNYIAHAMAHALCVGPFSDNCPSEIHNYRETVIAVSLVASAVLGLLNLTAFVCLLIILKRRRVVKCLA